MLTLYLTISTQPRHILLTTERRREQQTYLSTRITPSTQTTLNTLSHEKFYAKMCVASVMWLVVAVSSSGLDARFVHSRPLYLLVVGVGGSCTVTVLTRYHIE